MKLPRDFLGTLPPEMLKEVALALMLQAKSLLDEGNELKLVIGLLQLVVSVREEFEKREPSE